VQIPFGKYRGTSVTELPFDYLQWLTSIDLLDPLRAEVKKEYERRLCDQRQYEGLIDLK
jgi:Putative quorum-sensing-regulated virulence factor